MTLATSTTASEKVTLRVHGPNNQWTLSVSLDIANSVRLDLANGRWATVTAEHNYGGFSKVKKDYHFNPDMVVCVEIEDGNVPF